MEGVRAGDVTGREFSDVAAGMTRTRVPHMDEGAMRLGFALTRLSSAFTGRAEQRLLAEHGITWSGFRVLYITWLFEPVEARDIARLAGVSRQATSTVLVTLEKAGLIARERDSEVDRRLVSVRLTEQGRAVASNAFQLQNDYEADLFADLTPAERATLLGLLEKVIVRASR